MVVSITLDFSLLYVDDLSAGRYKVFTVYENGKFSTMLKILFIKSVLQVLCLKFWGEEHGGCN
jgi:hypothetical protein